MPPILHPALVAPPARVKSVLIVDADARVLRALAGLLAASDGLAVSGLAPNASRALAVDLERSPDVVLVDVLLPSLEEGLGLIRSLARRGRRVVALSGSRVEHDLALAAGAAAFLEKDTQPESLIAALRCVG